MRSKRTLPLAWTLTTRVALVLLVLCTGCYTTTYYTNNGPSAAEPDHEEWNHRWVMGLIETSEPVDTGEICEDGIAEITTEITAMNVAVTMVVQGLLNLAIAFPIYLANKEPGDDFPQFVEGSGESLNSPVNVWSPSTIKVKCAR
jgi:hypothetical protein